MKIGAHVSIAGGVFNAPLNAAKENMECFQMFSRSPRGGPAAVLDEATVQEFKDNCSSASIDNYYIHTPYYINFSSAKKKISQASVRIVREELERGSTLGATAVMTHLGSSKDVGPRKALAMTIAGLKKVLAGYTGSAQFLIENAAGAGNVIGASFDELQEIMRALKSFDIGVCFDTCHAFASGYDLRTKAVIKNTLDEFDKKIGLSNLKLVHANDSMNEFDSHKDRHEHIGEGQIGLAGWKELVANSILHKVDFVLETKPGTGRDKDFATLKKLRKK